jgi:hypothetical protein
MSAGERIVEFHRLEMFPFSESVLIIALFDPINFL